MEMFLNLIYFTGFYFIEIPTSLFWFFSTLNFSLTLLLKTYVVKLQNMNFQDFFCGELYRFGDINDLDLTNFKIQAQHKTFPKERVTCSFWWTL